MTNPQEHHPSDDARSWTTPDGSTSRLGLPSDSGSAADGAEGGEPACFLARVCPECGAVADTDPPTPCPRCGAQLPG